jgi:formylglycine-generating enzyme
MNKIILFILFTASLIYSAQFEILKDLNELPGDPAAKTFPLRDVNGDLCAILKIKTSVKGLSFKSIGYEKHDFRDGIYFVYLQNGTKNLTFIKTGYITFPYYFPKKILGNNVYYMEVGEIKEDKKLEDITINVEVDPKNSRLFVNGKDTEGKSSVKISSGKHILRIEKDRFQTLTDTIEVNPERTYFRYKLNRQVEASLTLNSDPSGADVYLDGIYFGKTPLSSSVPYSEYRLKLTKNGWEDLYENINLIPGGKFEKDFSLIDRRAILNIKSPLEADVKIEGIKDKISDGIKLPAGIYKITAEADECDPDEKTIYLMPEETKNIELNPRPFACGIDIDTDSDNSKVLLKGPKNIVRSAIGKASFENLPAGNYELKVTNLDNISEKLSFFAQNGKKYKIRLSPGKENFYLNDEVFVKGGTFPKGKYKVTLSDFIIGKYEVNQKLYEQVMKNNPSIVKGDSIPVENVYWWDCANFCNELSKLKGLDPCYYKEGNDWKWNRSANGYRLLTEMEWEWAAFGGINKSETELFYEYNLKKDGKLASVGTRIPNALGIYDMLGNAEEWCWNWWLYIDITEDVKDPAGPEKNDYRTSRTGELENINGIQYIKRKSHRPNHRTKYLGFRIARNAISGLIYESELPGIKNDTLAGLAKVEITSEPSGADIYFSGAYAGKTPGSFNFPKGTYDIRLSHKECDDTTEKVIVSSKGLNKNYILKKVYGRLKIIAEEGAEVFVNGEKTSDPQNILLSPQIAHITAKKTGSAAQQEKVLLRKNEEITLDLLFYKSNEGTIQIAVKPNDAQIELFGILSGKYFISQGSKTFENILSDQYRIRVKKEGFFEQFYSVYIAGSDVVRKAVMLKEKKNKEPDMAEVPGNDKMRAFLIGRYEITGEYFKDVTGKTAFRAGKEKYPVLVTWYDAVEFCNKLSEMEGLTKCYTGSEKKFVYDPEADGYRLPTSDEWVQAIEAGNNRDNFNFIPDLKAIVDKITDKSYPVGSMYPDELGVCDLLINATEWTTDCGLETGIGGSPLEGGKRDCTKRLKRGSFYGPTTGAYMSAVIQSCGENSDPTSWAGFRVARNLKK